MTDNPTPRNDFEFTPVILDQDFHEKRRIVRQLPVVHQTETIEKFFAASADHLFDPGRGRPINGYVGQKPLWYDPTQDYYLLEQNEQREFYQLEASMVSKDFEGEVTNLLPYPDLINQLRFQGAMTNNHNRLFSQEYYSWCPPVDLDKIINFRQYVWLPSKTEEDESFPVINITGPSVSYVSNGTTLTYKLPGYGTDNPDKREFYRLSSLVRPLPGSSSTTDWFFVRIDGEIVGRDRFNYVNGTEDIEFISSPPVDSVITFEVYSDVKNNAIGLPGVNPLAFGGVRLSSSMRIRLPKDDTLDFNDSDIFIVENVGRSIRLLKEENREDLEEADYLIMERGAFNGNEWSTGNRWFHVSTLSPDIDPDFVAASRATRPIIEFNRDLELFDYGLTRRLDVEMVVEDIEDFAAYLNDNQTSIVLNGQTITIVPDGIDVQIPGYGVTESFRIMIRNTIDEFFNNKIFALINQEGRFRVVTESDGINPAGDPEFGEVFRVNLARFAGRNLYFNGTSWVVGQEKTQVNQFPLFELYDLEGINLRDSSIYPNSNFRGSRIFGYQEDTSGTRLVDQVLGFPLVFDNRGQIQFENYLSTQQFSWILNGVPQPIGGFYFHKTSAHDIENQQLSNDWYIAPDVSKQNMIDRFVANGRTRTFRISQAPQELRVEVGRLNSNRDFERFALVEDRDFIRVDRDIMIFNIRADDIIEISTFNLENPPEDAAGFYEIPLNLQANPDNEEVDFLTRGDFYDHFSTIMKRQEGFQGQEFAISNYRDTPRSPNLGLSIIQHSAPLLKTMMLAADNRLDMMNALRYAEGEYLRFKDKFQQKIIDFLVRGVLTPDSSDDQWISKIFEEINRGKNDQFPFYLSGMARLSPDDLPTYIPPTPSYLGVYPLYAPQMFSLPEDPDPNATDTLWYVKGHDGSTVELDSEISARIVLLLEQRIFNSVPPTIRSRERPIVDWEIAHGDQYRRNEYSYDEFLKILRPTFERWAVTNGQDYRTNDIYDRDDIWTWNWSSVTSASGDAVPGHWRGIYQKFFGTQRPDLSPWECFGFTEKPVWWDSAYGEAPYTADNLKLWDDIEKGLIRGGQRQGINPKLARPGLSSHIPVDGYGRLRHPGPRWLPDDNQPPLDPNLTEDDYRAWEFASADAVLGCGILPDLPSPRNAQADWDWGDMAPIEQFWRKSSSFVFSIAQASYLMKPTKFVELGWNTEDSEIFFPGGINEQWMLRDTRGRPRSRELEVHGEIREDFSKVTKIGIQQWISDYLISRSISVRDVLGDFTRGLGSQLTYKVGGFTDSTTLIVVSDSFGRVPSEDVSISLFRSPSIREEFYSGVAIERRSNGYRIHGYDSVDPFFSIIRGSPLGRKSQIGDSITSSTVLFWRPNTYYSVNIIVNHDNRFYRSNRTHTSSSVFEGDFWNEVPRPQFADGARLAWYAEADLDEPVTRIPYGTILRTPQDVADFLNGYERFLESRGWLFRDERNDVLDTRDWRAACRNFIIWSSGEINDGDFLVLSPSSNLLRYKTDQGAIQPVEDIIKGFYAITDQNGRPIDPKTTRVVRDDGNITISTINNSAGIFGLRLFVSEIEHVMVFNNQTIFNDTIYNPLLNIKQPRLRLQGFKSIAWAGRVDAPGFIVTGDVLTPNFEKSADDFRRFFEVEAMENKRLQDLARANFGYEEKEYLNNLLLTPTNQFEFYQGMIQQKGSPTSMTRLLRSNFIRHNTGLQLFEEWAFRIGDYGGKEVQPQLDIKISQSDFKHNPQLITFDVKDSRPETNTYGVIEIVDLENDDEIIEFDDNWYWRPDTKEIKWPLLPFDSSKQRVLKSPGPVKLDEVRFTIPTYEEFDNLLVSLEDNGETIFDNDRVWIYGIGETTSTGTPDFDAWNTFKFYNTGFSIIDVVPGSFDDQSVVVVLNQTALPIGSNDPDEFYIVQPGVRERLILRNLDGSDLSPLLTYTPKFSNSREIAINAGSPDSFNIMSLIPQAEQVIRKITVNVTERFESGSTLIIGDENIRDRFIRLPLQEPRDIFSNDFENETVRINTPDESVVPSNATTFPVTLIRVGPTEDFCRMTTVDWIWTPVGGTQQRGSVEFVRASDFSTSDDFDETFLRSIPIDLNAGGSTVGQFTIEVGGNVVDQQTLTFIRANAAGQRFVDLTTLGSYEFELDESTVGGGTSMIAALDNTGITGRATITVEFFYRKGFEAIQIDEEDEEILVTSSEEGGTADIYTWIQTRYSTLSNVPSVPSTLWAQGDIVEIDDIGQGRWGVYQRNGSLWTLIRTQNRKIDSDQIKSAAIFNSEENRLRRILQLYDPAKGYIPGIADRELTYRLDRDPANYGFDGLIWGQEQVGRLWWNTSEVRYLDYEIYDDLENGVSYRWRNWGRIAPGSQVNIYEWVRSTTPPSDWNDFIQTTAASMMNPVPSGTIDNPSDHPFVEAKEWNDDSQQEETVFYFWVKNARTTPLLRNRRLTAQQVSNIITNPLGNDIPFVAIIDVNKVIMGGSKQFLDEENTILKIKWFEDTEIVNNHHKEWIILREADERNIIRDDLWDKMRDSLVGWDNTVFESKLVADVIVGDTSIQVEDASGFSNAGTILIGDQFFTYQGKLGNQLLSLPRIRIENFPQGRNNIPAGMMVRQANNWIGKDVPDARLPRPQQTGNLIRPRQSWYPADQIFKGQEVVGQRVSRAARETFVEAFNDLLSKEPFIDRWFDWRDLFEAGDPLPAPERYVVTALDLQDLGTFVFATLGAVQVNECVLVENTAEAGGIWTLWKLVIIDDERTFILEDFQKWRFKEGEFWSLADWYDEGWSPSDFPNFRFRTFAERDAAAPFDVTLLKGTLVQVDQQSPLDNRWSWEVYSPTTIRTVAKQNSTMRLNRGFFAPDRLTFGPKEVQEIIGTPFDKRITPDRIQSLAGVFNSRDGSFEIEFLINRVRNQLINEMQKNTLFFSMVKSAFKQNKSVDWAFKTSFLYLGGYSENLRQSPIAFKDQIDNVISYLEEVKPYHVKIREFVRRLSYGPDIANFRVTDFDKPVFVEGSTSRVLDINNPDDLEIIQLNRPWNEWFNNYQNTNFDPNKWDENWNPIRKMNISMKIDRVACAALNGWDTFPWSPNLFSYRTGEGTPASLSELNELYRNDTTTPRTNMSNRSFYRDTTVQNIEERNLLVRQNLVTSDRPGTIVNVLSTNQSFMWSGSDWIEFEVIGWDQGPDMGAASRIADSYRPVPGQIPADDKGLIPGCDFDGTVLTRNFKEGPWSIFEWESTGLSAEYDELIGLDTVGIDGNSEDSPVTDSSDIDIDGNEFTNSIDDTVPEIFGQPKLGYNRPREMIPVQGRDHLIITERNEDGSPIRRSVVNAVGKLEALNPTILPITLQDWNRTGDPFLRVTVPDISTLHDPQNPSADYIRNVLLFKSFRAILDNGQLTLTDSTDEVPFGLRGNQVRVAIVHPDAPEIPRILATVQDIQNGVITLDVPLNQLPNSTGLPKWNIIPLDIFHEPGVIWINNARFTYTEIIPQGGDVYHLTNAKLSMGTLEPVEITSGEVSGLISQNEIFNGSRLFQDPDNKTQVIRNDQ